MLITLQVIYKLNNLAGGLRVNNLTGDLEVNNLTGESKFITLKGYQFLNSEVS